MINIDNIALDVLGAVRQRLGANDENDTSCDERISNMTPKQFVAYYSGWILGSEEWANEFIDLYNELQEN